MATVQLAVRNRRYAAALADLLRQDESRDVLFVDSPRPLVDGIIVVDGRPENLLLLEAQPERFVVVTGNDANILSSVWHAGVRHVVFEGDSPATAFLAVVAAELRNPQPRDMGAAPATSFAGQSRRLGTPRSRFRHLCEPLP